MKLEHVALNVEDPKAMSEWWAKTLGMRVVLANEESPYIHFVVDSDGTSMLELYNNPAAPAPDYAAISCWSLHIAFSSSDIEGDRSKLVEGGATTEGEITVTPTGDKLAFFRDPWSTPFQLVERVKPLL